MNYKYKILFLFILTNFGFTQLFAQQYDANWVLGYNDTLYHAICGKVVVQHNNNELIFNEIETPLNFEKTSAAISTDDGDLLLYTNGCMIANSSHEIIKNGTGLNPGEVHDMVCENYGYIVPKGAMIIPHPRSNSIFVILHLGAVLGVEKQLKYNRLYFTLVDMKKNNGQGEVIEKNKIIVEGDLESFAVTKHGNGVDWWIIVPEYGTNIYHKVFLDKNGFQNKEDYISGFDFPKEICTYSSNSVFSPDGATYARYNSNCGFISFDFDRCQGILSDPKYSNSTKSLNITDGEIVISSKNILYSISPFHYPLYEYAFLDRILKFDLDNIGVSIPTPYVFKNNYKEFDIKPYSFINYNNGDLFFYALKNTGSFYRVDEIESEPDTIIFRNFEKKIPVLNARTSPYFPNYNLGILVGSLCDSVSSIDDLENINMIIYPNPLYQNLTIKSTDKMNGEFCLYYSNGKILKKYICKNETEKILYLDDLVKGFYILKYHSNSRTKIFKIIKH